MTATVADFIAAGVFILRGDEPQNGSSVSFSHATTGIPVPGATYVGQRISVTDGSHTDYYRLLDATLPSLISGNVFEWVDVSISPKTARAYAKGVNISFHPYAGAKANIPDHAVKQGGSFSVDLLTYFEMLGGKDADLTFIARPGGAGLAVSVTGGSTLNITGTSRGSVSVSVECRDRSQGRVTQRFRVTVSQPNRAPISDRALGNPAIGSGAEKVYDLDTYFSDPDGDVLVYTVSGANTHVKAIFSPSASDLSVSGTSEGSATLAVTATDPETLSTTQQMLVTIPPDRPPVVAKHFAALALATDDSRVNNASQTVQYDLNDYFYDPDKAPLEYLVQWEEGDATKQYLREFWHVTGKIGTNLLNLESLFKYPVASPRQAALDKLAGTSAPWGAGSPWTVPAGTKLTLSTAYSGSNDQIATFHYSLLSAATATWDATARRVNLSVRTKETLLVSALSPPSRLQFGDNIALCWPEGTGMDLNLRSPSNAIGSRTLYILVYDPGGQTVEQFLIISTGRPPTASSIPASTLFTGADSVVLVDDYFKAPTGATLTYIVAASVDHIVGTRISTLGGPTELQLHGLSTGSTLLTVTATDAIGLTIAEDIAVTVKQSAAAVPTRIITDIGAYERMIRENAATMTCALSGGDDAAFTARDWVPANYSRGRFIWGQSTGDDRVFWLRDTVALNPSPTPTDRYAYFYTTNANLSLGPGMIFGFLWDLEQPPPSPQAITFPYYKIQSIPTLGPNGGPNPHQQRDFQGRTLFYHTVILEDTVSNYLLKAGYYEGGPVNRTLGNRMVWFPAPPKPPVIDLPVLFVKAEFDNLVGEDGEYFSDVSAVITTSALEKFGLATVNEGWRLFDDVEMMDVVAVLPLRYSGAVAYIELILRGISGATARIDAVKSTLGIP